MLWEVEIRPLGPGRRAGAGVRRVRPAHPLDPRRPTWSRHRLAASCSKATSTATAARTAGHELLVDSVVEIVHAGGGRGRARPRTTITVLLKPGVMDPVAESVLAAARDLGMPLEAVRTFRRYVGTSALTGADRDLLFRKVLANDAIEQVVDGPAARPTTWRSAGRTRSARSPCRCVDLDDAGLMKLSRDGQLALNLAEMQAIQAHFRDQGRDPTDVELETIAQTWSEHCSHKTLKGRSTPRSTATDARINNLLKETIFAATQELRKRLGADDWCVSVFEDNAGVVHVRRPVPRLLQGRDAQPPVGHRAVRRGQHRPRRRHPRPARHRPRGQAGLQHRRLLLRPAGHAAGGAAAGRAAPAAR